MADIRPFPGVHYNPALVKDLAKVICPPYDIISPQLQQELYQRHEYNFVRIEWGREQPHDSETFNKYTRAASTLQSWLEHRILIADGNRALYIAEYTFMNQGKSMHRRNIYCVVKLEDWSKMVIRPHEGTLARAKSDRLNMLWALQANTSPIMALYEDKGSEVDEALKTMDRHKPFLSAAGPNGESHRVWMLTDNAIIARIIRCLTDQPLYIADGHHRYESALAYQRERRTSSPPGTKEAPYDFVMMTLVDIADPGLVILPAHRLVRGMTKSALESSLARLGSFFNITEHLLNKKDTGSQINRLLAGDSGGVKLVLCGLKPGRLLVLAVRDADAIRPMFPAFHSDIYQQLDVSIVDHVILEELLGLSHDKAGVLLDYNDDAVETIAKVLEGEYQLGIIVNPVRPAVVKAIADNGDRMPHKSTYFYPKAPAGLISYRFV